MKLKKNQQKVNEKSYFQILMRGIGEEYVNSVQHKSDKYCGGSISNLPMSVADLLISGFPLEFMNGETYHMPHVWLNAVFDALVNKLGDKRVYVISIMGIQSSGKSTLLNTMFGINFKVGGGSCTKGVFAQLISVDGLLANDLGYEYILLLDTEGLRAPEIGNTKCLHYEKIAALVITMADIIIVNIKGENTSEIEEILQISVHASVQMHSLKQNIKPPLGCYFVHQNVSDLNASEKMRFAYANIQKQLDEITITAAKKMGVSEIQSFNDVIDFDMNKQILYFPNLWKGDPPMAPVNPSYSEKAIGLKTQILNNPSEKNIYCLTFSDLKNCVSRLQKAILDKNIV
ncbi:unnamed protein product [Meganyctiphanes norvegica]|uniref:VLIG-type G domain-containing protein n=1 Tax=Meganyctiphanes norvegica TaxID=48144 RepID=A0AAV2R7Y1_MEGNR